MKTQWLTNCTGVWWNMQLHINTLGKLETLFILALIFWKRVVFEYITINKISEIISDI